jgi:hypothetical protein
MGIMDRLFGRSRRAWIRSGDQADIPPEVLLAAAQIRPEPLEAPSGFGLYVVRCIVPPEPGRQYERHYVRSYDDSGAKLTDDIEDAQRFGPREATELANMIRDELGLVVVIDEVAPRDL